MDPMSTFFVLNLLGGSAAGGEQSDQGTAADDREQIVEGGVEASEDVERSDDNGRVEDGIVVEDRIGGRLIVGDDVLLPQDSFVLLLLRHGLRGEGGEDLLRDGILTLLGDLMLQHELDVLVGKGHQIGVAESAQKEGNGQRQKVDFHDAPVDPWIKRLRREIRKRSKQNRNRK